MSNYINNEQIDVSAILVSYNTESLLSEALYYLENACNNIYSETIIIDNASIDNSIKLIKSKFPELSLIINKKNIGFGRANNNAVMEAKGRYILLLNTDAFVATNSLTETIEYMDTHPRCGILGVKLVGRDGILQPSCRYFPTPWNLFLERSGFNRFFPNVKMVDDMNWDHTSVRECDWVPGCFYLIRREVIDQVGLFDPRYFLYYEEVDHCLSAKKAGWEVHFFPHTSVIHLGGESAKSKGSLTEGGRQLDALQTESELLYFRKNLGWRGFILHVLLSTSADLINIIKGILKARPYNQWNTHVKHLTLLWQLIFRTHNGLSPTR